MKIDVYVVPSRFCKIRLLKISRLECILTKYIGPILLEDGHIVLKTHPNVKRPSIVSLHVARLCVGGRDKADREWNRVIKIKPQTNIFQNACG